MPAQSGERQARLAALLQENKRRLWNELREEIFNRNAAQIQPQFEIPQDPGEQSMIDLLEDTNLAVADIRRQALTQLDEAMGRLERGEYGVCRECGREIDEKRLAVAPYSVLCVDCQKKHEDSEFSNRPTL